jgi:hypothetical protein
MSYQEILLAQIRKQLSNNNSINEEIASILEISYDAAHRRVSGKSKFTIDEVIQIANHFNFSLDKLFVNKEKVIVEKTVEISNLNDMKSYFTNAALQIEKLTQSKKSNLYYSAKDIPLFYFMDATLLSKFKAYVWLNLLNLETSKIPFEKFLIDESFLEPMQKLKKAYEKTEVKEVWNDTTINSSLQQILYFYEAGLLNYKSASILFNELKKIILAIKEKSNKLNSKYSIYYNELILLNNNLLFESENKLTLFVPYTLLGFFITDNEDSCKNVYLFFNQQILNSIPINKSGIKEHNLFFSRMLRKIEFYVERLNNQVDIQF